MLDWRSARNVLATAAIAGMTAWGYQAVSAPGPKTQQAWSFDMWCLEMQLYPSKRCDARLTEDMKDYEAYRADVEKYHEEQQSKDKRDQEILDRQNRNLPGSPLAK